MRSHRSKRISQRRKSSETCSSRCPLHRAAVSRAIRMQIETADQPLALASLPSLFMLASRTSARVFATDWRGARGHVARMESEGMAIVRPDWSQLLISLESPAPSRRSLTILRLLVPHIWRNCANFSCQVKPSEAIASIKLASRLETTTV